jgi:hypothetical protein
MNLQTLKKRISSRKRNPIGLMRSYDLPAIEEIIMPSANIGIVSWRDGEWVSSDITFENYIERIGKRELIPYYEPPRTYNVEISEGQLAFVKADCILHRLGIARSHNVDFFMLIKNDGKWKMVNASFTSKALPEEDQEFDLDIFARSYAQSWGSKRPNFVAMYFAEEGSLQVNDAEVSVGREAITDLALGFMTDLPDMVVRYDSLVPKNDGADFHWTLIATYSGSNGNGNKVNVSGYEEWQIENGLIKQSQGHFPTEEYNKQIGL